MPPAMNRDPAVRRQSWNRTLIAFRSARLSGVRLPLSSRFTLNPNAFSRQFCHAVRMLVIGSPVSSSPNNVRVGPIRLLVLGCPLPHVEQRPELLCHRQMPRAPRLRFLRFKMDLVQIEPDTMPQREQFSDAVLLRPAE